VRLDFEVRRNDLHEHRLVESSLPELAPGGALLRVDRFAFTANNITYAVLGDALQYWEFFPTEAGWGRIPVWGFADVVAAGDGGPPVGARVFGYLPMSTHLVVRPERVRLDGFTDASPHRAVLPAAYNWYRRVDTDPQYDQDEDGREALLRPLFITSFLIAEQLIDNECYGASTVVLSSASSKTALGTAFMLKDEPGLDVVALSSRRNAAFIDHLGFYSASVNYDDVATLPGETALYVDFSGDADVRRRVHERYGDGLRLSLLVGATHQHTEPPGELAGPAPVFFFAPDQIRKRGGLDDTVTAAWRRFVADAPRWLEVIEGNGAEDVAAVYLDVLDGRVEPSVGHVLSM